MHRDQRVRRFEIGAGGIDENVAGPRRRAAGDQGCRKCQEKQIPRCARDDSSSARNESSSARDDSSPARNESSSAPDDSSSAREESGSARDDKTTHRREVQRVPLATFARRVAGAIAIVWLVLTLTFLLVRVAPGDPAALLIPPGASASDVERLRADLGLNRPLAVQYARWSAALLRGDMGESFALKRPVRAVIADALPISAALGAVSLALTFLIGVPIGMIQARRRGSWTDRALTITTVALYAAPSFWLALALVGVFTYGAAMWGLPAWMRMPAFGVETPGAMLHGGARVADVIRHAVLPVSILAAIGAAGIARYARTSIADVMQQDFVRTARAKGASEARVDYRHVLATILPAMIVLFALALPGVVAGSVFVESVFSWPGMGKTMLTAINARDYPLVMGATAVYAAVVVFANLAADLALPLVDPRRRAQ
jgi:peptide/nickel transport system permease protein